MGLNYRPGDYISSGQPCILSGKRLAVTPRGLCSKTKPEDLLRNCNLEVFLFRNLRFLPAGVLQLLTRNGWQVELAKCM